MFNVFLLYCLQVLFVEGVFATLFTGVVCSLCSLRIVYMCCVLKVFPLHCLHVLCVKGVFAALFTGVVCFRCFMMSRSRSTVNLYRCLDSPLLQLRMLQVHMVRIVTSVCYLISSVLIIESHDC